MNFILKKKLFIIIAAFLNLTAVFAAKSQILGVTRFSRDKSLVLYTSKGKAGLEIFAGEKSEEVFIPGFEDIKVKNCIPLEYQDFNGFAFLGEKKDASRLYWIYEDKGNFFLRELCAFDFDVSKIEQSFREDDFFIIFCSGENVLYKVTLNFKSKKFFACKQIFNSLDSYAETSDDIDSNLNEEKLWESDSYWQEDEDVVTEDYVKKASDENFVSENETKFYTELLMGKFYCLVSSKNSNGSKLFFVFSENSCDTIFLIDNDFKSNTSIFHGLTSDNRFYFSLNELNDEKYDSKLMVLNKEKFDSNLSEIKNAKSESKLNVCSDIFESRFDSPLEIEILKYDEFPFGQENVNSESQSENAENSEENLLYVYGKKFNKNKFSRTKYGNDLIDKYVLLTKYGNEKFREYIGTDEIFIYRNFYDSFDFVMRNDRTNRWTYFCLWKNDGSALEAGEIVEFENIFDDCLVNSYYLGSFVGSTFDDSLIFYFSYPNAYSGVSFRCEYGSAEERSVFRLENVPSEIKSRENYGSECFKNKITSFSGKSYFSLENQIFVLDESSQLGELVPCRNFVQSSFRWNKSIIACSDDEKIFCFEVEAQ